MTVPGSMRVFLAVIISLSVASGGNVLISVTCGEGSHYMAAAAIGEALVRRGHNVTVLVGNAYEHRAHHPVHSQLFNFEIFTFSVPVEAVHERMEEVFSHAFEKEFKLDFLKNIPEMIAPYIEDCRAILSDHDLMSRLQGAKFDVTIFDVTFLCSMLIASHVNTTNVLFHPLASQYFSAEMFAGSPFLPSIIPGFTGCTQYMNFWQRLVALLTAPCLRLGTKLYTGLFDPVKDEFGIMAGKSVFDIVNEVQLLLMNMDPVVDLISPFPPAVIEVGGLLTRPSDPLEKVGPMKL